MIRLLKKLGILFSRQDFIRFGILAALLVSVGLLELLSLSAIPLYIGTVTEQTAITGYYRMLPPFLQKICGNVYWFSLLFIILYFLRMIYLRIVTRLQYHIISNRKTALTGRIYDALLNAPYSFLLSQPQAFLTHILTRSTYNITFMILAGLLTLIRCFFLSVLTAGLVLAFHFRLSIMAILFLILTCGIHMYCRSRRLKRTGAAVNQSQQQAIQAVTETLQAVPETKIYQLQKYFKKRMHEITEKESRGAGNILVSNQILWPTLELLTLASLIAAMLITMAAENKTPLQLAPALTLLTVALTRLKVFFSDSMLAVNAILCNQEDLNQTCALLTELQQQPPCPEPQPVREAFQELSLDKVGFSFHEGQPVLKDISFTLKKGQSMGIAGPTGSGKSTLLNIILGLLPPDRGSISVNQRNLKDCAGQWQSRIGYVPQNIALFDDTILRNIALGVPEDQIDRDRFRKAVEAAQLTDCLLRQPRQEYTLIGDQGRKLSGGERQRIGIARALYRNPDILILDEATSALDVETEQAITDTIRHLKGTVTMIIVAHRLTTIRQCDFIYHLDNNR